MRIDARLREEHDVIEGVTAALDELLDDVGGGRPVPMLPVVGAIEIFTIYVDASHETAEERIVLPALARRGGPTSHLLDRLQREHEAARRLLRALPPVRAGRVESDLATRIRQYTSLLHRHIALENAALLPEVGRAFSADDEDHMQRELDRLDDQVFGPSGRQALLALAHAVRHACRAPRFDSPAGSPRTAADVMRVRPLSVAPDESLSRAAAMMESSGSRELPVVGASGLTGIIARSDLEPHRGHWEWTRVRNAMTPDPVTVAPQASMREVAHLLLERGFNAVPVVDDGRLVGMIGRNEVLRLVQDDERFGTS